jgi:hypothetical protein
MNAIRAELDAMVTLAENQMKEPSPAPVPIHEDRI